MKSVRKILIFLVIVIGFYVIFRVVTVSETISDTSSVNSSIQALVDNFKLRENEILELKRYFESIVPDSFRVYIEFKDDETIDFWVLRTELASRSPKSSVVFEQWDINPYDYIEKPMTLLDSSYFASETISLEVVKKQLGWNMDTFKQIKYRLDKAGCISVNNYEPTEIGFGRRGMGKYSYIIFAQPIFESDKHKYNDSCTYILYNNTLALQYTGGAVGSQCFPDLRQDDKEK